MQRRALESGGDGPAPQRQAGRPRPAGRDDRRPPVLVARKVLTPEQAERARRSSRMNNLAAGAGHRPARPGQRGPDRAGAGRPGRPALREDQPARPRPRRRHQGHRRALRAQARHGRHLQDRRHDHGGRPQPLRALPRRRHQARHRPRRRARGGHAQRRGDGQQGLLRPQDQPQDRGEAAHGQPPRHRGPRQPGVPLRRDRGAGPRGGAGGQGARPHPELRLRAARLRHPLRAQARPDPGAPAHRRDPARRAPDPARSSTRRWSRASSCSPAATWPRSAGRRTGASSASRAAARSSCASPPCPPPSARRRCCASSTPTSC